MPVAPSNCFVSGSLNRQENNDKALMTNDVVWPVSISMPLPLKRIIRGVNAFQMRNLPEAFNESLTLAVMVYSNFIFVMLRLVIQLLSHSENRQMLSRLRSIVLSLDTIATILIYFVPKFLSTDRSSTSKISLRRFSIPSIPRKSESSRISRRSSNKQETKKCLGDQVVKYQ